MTKWRSWAGSEASARAWSPSRPRGCAPIVKAFREGREFAEPWQDARTIADGLRVPAAIGDFLILRALRESRGTAVAVSDESILDATYLIGRTQGTWSAPEGGATLAAFLALRDQGWIGVNESVVLFITGSGAKYSAIWARPRPAG